MPGLVETPEKPTKKSDKDIDLSNSERGVWLVKVPKYIADRWSKADPCSEVGRLRIIRAGGAKPDVTLRLADKIIAPIDGISELDKLNLVRNSATSQVIPKDHKFSVSASTAITLGVISSITDADTNPPTDKISMEGRVVQRAECRPIQSKTYMDIKKEAISKAGEPIRRVMRLDKHVSTSYRPISNHATNIMHEKKKKIEGKKLRDDKDKVQEMLFALFEKHQYYNIKDLVASTRQPVGHLKDILKELCDYNVKQPHRGMWELKPEFRHYKQEEAAKKNDGDSSDSD